MWNYDLHQTFLRCLHYLNEITVIDCQLHVEQEKMIKQTNLVLIVKFLGSSVVGLPAKKVTQLAERVM